jgi:hypothetical protein
MAEQFHLFPELPRELQIKIWLLTCEVPRIIELGSTPKNWIYRGRAVEDVDIWRRIMITSNSLRLTLIPPALETCFLSRQVALKFYNGLKSGYSFFNPAIDTLYFGKEFDITRGWDHWRKLAYKTDIRHFAFHLPTFRYRPDFHYIVNVARARQAEGITFVLDARIDSPCQDSTVAPRFKALEHYDIAADKTLRNSGQVFKEAQSHIITESYDTNDRYFRQYGRYQYKDAWQAPWKMPKIKFMLEDEQQARNDREVRRVRQELAAIAKAEAAAVM